VTTELLALHQRFHDELRAAGLSSDPYYLPGAWVPHCTITVEDELPRVLEVIESIHGEEVLGQYPVSEIHVVQFRPTVSLASFSLSSGGAAKSRAGRG
jgi:hypothetical protein